MSGLFQNPELINVHLSCSLLKFQQRNLTFSLSLYSLHADKCSISAER
jgi:hypothetical protein